jgi:16S rRNA (guanine966-N2)-methyltransferase
VRQAVFNILEHGMPGLALEGARALDLFAGTGALGFEALSRGAAACLFVDSDAAACRLIKRNAARLGLAGRTSILRLDATQLPAAAAGDGDRQLLFLDPPYGHGLAAAALERAIAGGWLARNALIVVEESSASSITWPPQVRLVSRRAWGRTSVAFARLESAA